MIMWTLMLSFSMMSILMKNLISMWFFMEISTLLFISMLMKNENPLKSPFIYFLISLVSSMMIFLYVSLPSNNFEQFSLSPNYSEKNMMMMMFLSMNKKNYSIPTMAFFMKMGVIPFHSWVYKMTENMKWTSMMTLFTIMKITPIWFISMHGEMKMMIFFLIMNFSLSMWLPFKENNSFYMMSTSMVNNNSWIIISSISSIISTIMFSMIYFSVNLNLISLLEKTNSKIKIEKNSNLLTISILAIMGFPPMPLFFMKIMIIKNMMFIQPNLMMMSIILMTLNLMSTMMYMKFSINPFLKIKNLKNWKKNNMMNMSIFLTIQLSFISFLTSMMIV